jgi:hypothetical protein
MSPSASTRAIWSRAQELPMSTATRGSPAPARRSAGTRTAMSAARSARETRVDSEIAWYSAGIARASTPSRARRWPARASSSPGP